MNSQVEVTSCCRYSMSQGQELAYQTDYSDGTKVRTVINRQGWIRNEYLKGGAWVLAGKPYVVKKNNKRQGERAIARVNEFLAA